jgi:hypothetical protein
MHQGAPLRSGALFFCLVTILLPWHHNVMVIYGCPTPFCKQGACVHLILCCIVLGAHKKKEGGHKQLTEPAHPQIMRACMSDNRLQAPVSDGKSSNTATDTQPRLLQAVSL